MKLLVLSESNKKLNPNIWDKDNLRDDVKDTLLQISKDFQNEHKIPDNAVTDVIFTGSLANFNWTESSDIDLHIVVDFNEIKGSRGNDHQLLSDYYRASKSLWNNDHSIKICNFEVEIYVQKNDEKHHSTGVYSIIDDKWISEPKFIEEIKPDDSKIKKKSQKVADKIDSINSYEDAIDLKNKIKEMRGHGLENGGEYSVDNLVFKSLRNDGHLGKLSDKIKSLYDSQYSMGCEMESKLMESGMNSDTNSETVILPNGKKEVGSSTHEIVDAFHTLERLRKDKENNLPLDKKLELVFDNSKNAYKMAALSIKRSEEMKYQFEKEIRSLYNKLDRLASGKPLKDTYDKSSSIFDDE